MRKLVRKGTSFQEFEARFPDSDSCLAHVFESRFGMRSRCPKCKQATDFLRVSGTNRFMPRCCFEASINPLTRTVFSRTCLPLLDWFRCMLYMTNAPSGVTPSFIRRQFGISRKAAVRMAALLRKHLAAIERTTLLGSDVNTVFVDEAELRNVIVPAGKKGVPHRLLVATDGTKFLAVVVHRGRFPRSRSELTARIADGARVEIRTAQTHRKLMNFKSFKNLHGHPIEISTTPDRKEYYLLSVFAMKLKQFILKPHIWVSNKKVDQYIGHFTFLYNRRAKGKLAFWDAVSTYPKLI